MSDKVGNQNVGFLMTQLTLSVLLLFTGPRLCIGEPLARMELFLIFTNLIQKFKFLKAKETDNLTTEGVQALTLTPLPYELRAIPI